MLSSELENIYRALSSLDNLQKIESDDANYKYVWRVNFSFYSSENKTNKKIEIPFDISIQNDFPQSFPRVYLPNDFFEKFGYLPHVDRDIKDRPYLCIHDIQEAQIVPGRETDFFAELIGKTKSELRRGIAKENFEDYQEEFLAYWNKNYPNSKLLPCPRVDSESSPCLGLVYGEMAEGSWVDLLLFNPKFTRYDFHIFDTSLPDGKIAKENLFNNFTKNHSTSLLRAIFCGELSGDPLRPPFEIKCNELLSKIRRKLLNSIEAYYKNNTEGLILLFSKIANKKRDKEKLYFGVILPSCSKPNGFRSSFKWLSSNRNTLERVSLKSISNKKLELRTRGKLPSNESVKACVIGCGSVGSVVIELLIDEGFTKLLLVDNDIFDVENIKRHSLSIDCVGNDKAASLKKVHTSTNPFLDIESFRRDGVDFFEKRISSIQLCFIVVGNENIERKIREVIYSRKIDTPVVFLWIEPYCIAGHCLYIKNASKDTVERLFEQGLFSYNVIDRDEYLKNNEQLLKKESGCQTAFVPYSYTLIKQFIYSISDRIFQIIDSKSSGVKVISWVGQITKARELEIGISEEYSNKDKFCLIEWL